MNPKEKRELERQELSNKRRSDVLQAAKRVFVSKGIESATMSDIALEAEMGVASVYRYFNTKPELVIETGIDYCRDAIASQPFDVIIPALSGLEQVRRLLDALTRLCDERQDFQGEDHLLYVAGMGKNQPGRTVDAVGEQVEHHQAGEKDQGEFGLRITGCLPAGLEDHAEDESIHGEHEQRMEKGPENTEKRSPVAAHHLPLHRFPDQVAVAPATGDHFLWGERKRQHQASPPLETLKLLKRNIELDNGKDCACSLTYLFNMWHRSWPRSSRRGR